MWSIVFVAVLIALTGYYATEQLAETTALVHARASMQAESIAAYRNAVVAYFNGYPDRYGSVDLDTLRAAGAFFAQSSLADPSAQTIWTNYRDLDGMIYVYAEKPPAVNMVPELVAISQNSMLVGFYRTGDTTLYSPMHGDTRIKLPPPTALSIPNGSPIWIAIGPKG